MIEKRRQQRYDLTAIVRYARSSDTSDNVSRRGVIKNYSQSGICLITTQPLAEGQEIVVINLAVASSKKAIVRWQQKISDDSYNIGLEYIKCPVVDPGLHS
jgi:PilZ domain